MCRRLVGMVAVGALACGGEDREDSGALLEADPVPFDIEDEGAGSTPTSAACDSFRAALVLDQGSLDLLYEHELGITPAPQLDFDERLGVLAWVAGCYGDASVSLTSLTASGPDHLVAEYALSGALTVGAERVHPYLLVSLERAGWDTLESTIVVP